MNPDPKFQQENIEIISLEREITVKIPGKRKTSAVIFLGALCFFFIFKAVQSFQDTRPDLFNNRPEASSLDFLIRMIVPALWMLIACAILFQFARSLTGSYQFLHCTPERLEISRVDFGKSWYYKSFAVPEVEGLRFGTYTPDMYGSTMGLLFEAKGRTFKTLPGLKIIEANAIMKDLKKLGLDVTHDPAIRMLIEMETERRKSFFKWLT